MSDVLRGADPAVVGPYLAEALGDAAWTSCDVTLIAGGKSNLTFGVTSPAGSVVLRRPPLGHILPSAHDMAREHRMMAALAPTPVPVPRMLAFCDDASVLGQPFYVMERVEGHICREALPPGYADTPDQRRAVGEGLVGVLADLHEVDPAEVGLAQLGRADGYLTRQLRRWGMQWDATRIEGHEDLDALHAALTASIPESPRQGIVHGDYRLDNAMLHPTEPGRISAVLDWEMATLGDPIADLGLLLVYWTQADDGALRGDSSVVPSATSLDGFPTRAQVAELYATRTGADLTALPWTQAFGFYKLAVVCAGIVARAAGGSMLGDGFDVADKISPLTDLGRATLAGGTLH
jgi:aminoglycoside phosphotransferase (APT) family kinase protein